jgi:ribosomal 50S subunit-recycling heat shock protein
MEKHTSDDEALCFWLEYGGRRLVLSEGTTVVGRGAGCQIVLDDALVSRRHAEIKVNGGQVEAEDLGSSNGVVVNGRRIKGRAKVKAGDTIKIGQQELVLRSGRVARRRGPASRFAAKTLTGVEAAELIGGAGEDFEGESTQETRALILLGGVADKVLALGRGEEAERVLAKFLNGLLAGVQQGREADADTVAKAVEYAVRIAGATGKGRWVDYCFELYTGIGRPLPSGVVDELYTVLRKAENVNRKTLTAYVELLRENQAQFGPADRFLTQRIEGLDRLAALK